VTDAVIVSTARSPIGRAFKGSLKDMRPDDLSVQMIAAALAKIPALNPADIEDLYWGCAEPSGKQGANMARVIAVLAGFDHLPASTSTGSAPRRCRRPGWPSTRSRRARATCSSPVASSVCRSTASSPAPAARTPTTRTRSSSRRSGPQRGHGGQGNEVWTDPRELGIIPDVYLSMGQTAENVATSRGISRARQDEWGVASQNRAEAAINSGFFAKDITPVTLPDGTQWSTDDGPRAGVTLEAVSGLKTVFRETAP
jgi:acetyl-CoA C-acetyltransferase